MIRAGLGDTGQVAVLIRTCLGDTGLGGCVDKDISR